MIQEHGIDLGPMVPRLAEVLRAANGRLRLAPPYSGQRHPGHTRSRPCLSLSSVVSDLSAQDIEAKPPASAGPGLERGEPSAHLLEAGSTDSTDLALDLSEPRHDDRLYPGDLLELLAEVDRGVRRLDLCRESLDRSSELGQLTLDPFHSRR